MTSSIVGGGQESVTKFFEILQSDLKTLAGETKKKYPQIKEVYFVYNDFVNFTKHLLYINA